MGSVEQERGASGHSRTRSLEELYELHAPGLRRRCRRLTRDPHAAEDLMQEVFVRFMTRFPEGPSDVNVAGYLYATARNVLWKQLRDDHEIPEGEIESWAGPDDDLETDPERSTLLGEQQRIVRRCSAALTGRQRRALTLREIEGRSYAEIGSDLGIGTDAVAQVISRARARLRVGVRRAQVDLDQLSPECRAMLGPLSDYLDGHAAHGSAEIEAHLNECASCRHSLASFQTAGSRLRGTLPFMPVAGILARIGEAVRLGGDGPLDAVRAGALVLATAAAIGGGGMYVAHDMSTGSPPHRAQELVRVGPAGVAPISSSRHVLRGAGGAAGTPAPAATPGEHRRHGVRPTSSARPIVHATPTITPAHGPTVAAPVASPVTGPLDEPAHPAATPIVDPPTRPETTATATPPATAPGVIRPPVPTVPSGVVKPPVHTAVSKVDPLVAPVAKAVSPVTDPVTKSVSGVTAPVTKAASPVTDPVTRGVGAVTAPGTRAVSPVTDPVTTAVSPVTDPVTRAVSPVTDPIVKAAVPPAAPTTPPTSVPATTAPPATPAPPTPGITLPSIKVGLG